MDFVPILTYFPQQIYQKYKRELCIIVTNLSHMSTEYLHVKTTPQMPVRIAVRMSMSIPGTHDHLKSSVKTEVLVYKKMFKLFLKD